MRHRHHIIPRESLRFRHHLRIRVRRPYRHRAFFAKTIAAQIHAWAALCSFFGIIALFFLSSQLSAGRFAAVLVFGISSVLLFGASALMHFLIDGFRVSRRLAFALETLDKLCIYMLIAGTYTAVLHAGLVEPMRSNAIQLVWLVAAFGSVYTMLFEKLPEVLQSRLVSTGLYVAMGWIGVFYAKELFAGLTAAQVFLVVGGGVTYSVGALIYYLEKPNISASFGYHEIWHTMVAIGCSAYVAVVALSM